MRSLARDMGRDLVFRSHRRVRRSRSSRSQEDFVTIAELEAARFGAGVMKIQMRRMRPTRRISSRLRRDRCASGRHGGSAGLPQIAISDDAATKIRLGNPVIIRGRDACGSREACATARGKLVAISAIEQGMFKPKRVLPGDGARP
jgi:tRNA pseudouridine55 synthase